MAIATDDNTGSYWTYSQGQEMSEGLGETQACIVKT